MAHAIEDYDRLAVGYTNLYGKAWHEHENCTHYPENIPIERAEAIFDFNVEKRPVWVMNNSTGELEKVSDQFLLVDEDNNTVLSPTTVRERYDVIQPAAWFDIISLGVLTSHDLLIESCGTLFNRGESFVNAVVMEHTVKGDVSPTLTRLLYTNSFAGRAYRACANSTRVVCNNTRRMAMAQGAANNTLRTFRHTKSAVDAMSAYSIELADLMSAVRIDNDIMDVMATEQLKSAQVKEFIQKLFEFDADDDDGRGKTLKQNKGVQVLELFETKEDLISGPIKHTKYAMLNAVTDWADHTNKGRKDSDDMSRTWDGIFGGRDAVKQKAFQLLAA